MSNTIGDIATVDIKPKKKDTIESILRSIVKEKKFIKDEVTGYYYINNDIDGNFLFEFNPHQMTIYVARYIIDYIEYRGLLTENTRWEIRQNLVKIFCKCFASISVCKESEIESIKRNKIVTALIKDFNKILTLPYITDLECVTLDLRTAITPIDFDLSSTKVVKKDFHNIDVSGMKNGYYSLYITAPGLSDKYQYSVKIINK